MNDNPRNELLEKIKTSNNVLVTVNRNPSVDQLSASIGLTLMLNKLNKHSTTVFSGLIPAKLDFLEPEKTIETNTDSLRDFIISLDKEKADKLKYKQEDGQVKIFITPYRTSISESDLEFSQGDFNVDLIIVLGAVSREELDQAIISHGRILHDATIATIGTTPDNKLGSINFSANTSSICEILAGISDQLGQNLLDNQIATSLLTGIVSETDRFSNNKTSSETLAVSSKLVAAGANQQLVATKLSENLEILPDVVDKPTKKTDDTNLKIKHSDLDQEDIAKPEAQAIQSDDNLTLSEIEESNRIGKLSSMELPKVEVKNDLASQLIKNPSDNQPEIAVAPIDNNPQVDQPIVNPVATNLNDSAPADDSSSNLINTGNNKDDFINEAKEQLEQARIDQARQEVDNAMLESDQPIKPIESLNAQPVIEVDHQELNEGHNIKVDDNGQIIIEDNEQTSATNESTPHELKLNPIHDLKKNVLDNLSQDLPPPVPPPIPMS